MSSSLSSAAAPARPALQPQRGVGRRRVESLLEAASAIIAERGFEAATMAEVAARADARIGSLYRFFPSKEALADALRERYVARAAAAYETIERRVHAMTTDELADVLADFMVTLHDETKALSALLDSRGQGGEAWASIRTFAVVRIARVLALRSPALGGEAAQDLAILVLNVMKLMVAMTVGGTAPTSPGAVEALRAMNRAYLASRLQPPALKPP